MRYKERLDWQVKNSMQSKKVVLFIVEGITDEISIGYIITKLNRDNKVFFQIVNKDLTSDYSSDSSNIIKKIYDQIKCSMEEKHFIKNDIIKVIHLIDTDGVYAKEECIKYKDVKNVEYKSENIYTNNVDKIKQRNIRKSQILNKLSTTKEISKIPYEVYFFSTNLEHVLHNIQNAMDSEKQKLAEEFQDRYYDRPEDFIEFINKEEFAVPGSYSETWEFIKNDNNSLKRYTNFGLWFK